MSNPYPHRLIAFAPANSKSYPPDQREVVEVVEFDDTRFAWEWAWNFVRENTHGIVGRSFEYESLRHAR